MKAQGIFLTGYPGFLAGRLFTKLWQRFGNERHYHFLVEARFLKSAEAGLSALAQEAPELQNRYTLWAGDLTLPNFGLQEADLASLRAHVVQVWHLAAIYDLHVPADLAFAVNVEGTERVLDFCSSLQSLDSIQYISTCYVAGDRTGLILESELDQGQGFKNHYESTKFEAEKRVQARWQDLPTTIHRPAIVVGDSKSGETVKGDGPYFLLQFLKRLPAWFPMPHFGPSQVGFNVVPVDWLVAAMDFLAADPRTRGEVLQLADPQPWTGRQWMEAFLQALNRSAPRWTLPKTLAEAMIRLPGVPRLTGIPREAFVYFNHPARYSSDRCMSFLQDGGPNLPRPETYAEALAAFAMAHPEIYRRPTR
ncbi:MAG: NAD-dependent epimerase/dehydratase family protein [Planctomycetota bacterium]|nr:MAG: NAD-dependent epimerase/dehydratase family protein [Planctomycetota bacterium]